MEIIAIITSGDELFNINPLYAFSAQSPSLAHKLLAEVWNLFIYYPRLFLNVSSDVKPTSEQIFREKIGNALFVQFCSKKQHYSVPILFYQQIEEFKAANADPGTVLQIRSKLDNKNLITLT